MKHMPAKATRSQGLPRTCFNALVREQLREHTRPQGIVYRLQGATTDALRQACEVYLMKLFEQSDTVRKAGGHSMLHIKHMQCARQILANTDSGQACE